MQAPRIATFAQQKFIGKRITMSLNHNRTAELFKDFMPRRKLIKNVVGSDVFCMQVYPIDYSFKRFNPLAEFEKWAAVPVNNADKIPPGMEAYTIYGGLYAVFIHVGAAPTAQQTFQYIFNDWIPKSMYDLDQREHFEILGEKYKNDDPASEEEVWIPVKPKTTA